MTQTRDFPLLAIFATGGFLLNRWWPLSWRRWSPRLSPPPRGLHVAPGDASAPQPEREAAGAPSTGVPRGLHGGWLSQHAAN